MLDEVRHMREMTDAERLMFQNEYNAVKKNPTTAIVLALFLGGLGAHRFYLGQIGWGVVYVLFVWTFIPVLVALIECFLLKERVRSYNEARAAEIATKIKALRR